jgi:2-polyprenyl-3-methyl-5-hydroxy-6-metoxy-1,4-benzoquinol methylase/glycosyltransferase involved in cell wall biosynthesis
MNLAYLSPLNPQRSGISDYSEELLPHLAELVDVHLFVDGFRPDNPTLNAFPQTDYKRNPQSLKSLDQYDAVVYHMGNDHRYHSGIFDVSRQHPGIVVFHDYALQDFFIGLARTRKDMSLYYAEVAACHGPTASREAERAFSEGRNPPALSNPIEFPLNCRIARQAEGIIVHSEWLRTKVQATAPGVPVARIPMGVKIPPLVTNGNGSGPLKLASFGLIIPGKGIEQILRCLAAIRQEYDFHYTLVGAENPYFDVRSLVSSYNLNDRVTITGHIPLEEFERHIADTDIALNLRERTAGETSASLCRIMAAGVPVIASNIGAFAELPDDTVVKLDHDVLSDRMLQAYLRRLMDDPKLRQRLGENARRYFHAEHDIKVSARRYVEFIGEVVARRGRRPLVEGLSAELKQLGIQPSDESFLHSLASEVAALTNGPLPSVGTQPASDNSQNRNAVASGRIEVTNSESQRLPKLPDVNYKQAAIDYPSKLDPERHHYLATKPFYNLANKPAKHLGDGLDAETFRHFCDFANMAVALALPAGKKILDVGCGSGWLSEYFARLGYEVTGIDISPQLIEIAQKRVESLKYDVDHETRLRCRFITHDIEVGPLGETFDAVVCYDSLHHFEDEEAVMRNLAAMTMYGGQVFILEGDRPEHGSETEEELIDVMRRYETLESPFNREYLRHLLEKNGLAVIGDYISVNGLFERGASEFESPEVNYLLAKKVVKTSGSEASTVADSTRPEGLRAAISIEPVAATVGPGTLIETEVSIENTGTALWLVGRADRKGSVMLGLRLYEEHGSLMWERHGTPPLPRALAPGEKVTLPMNFKAPFSQGTYTLKVDMVSQHVRWFEGEGLDVTFAVQ